MEREEGRLQFVGQTICEDRTRRIASGKWCISMCICPMCPAFYIGIPPPVFTPPYMPSSNSALSFLLRCVSPPFFIPIKSLEASRRGRERRLVTFPSRPLFLSYTYARVRTSLIYTYTRTRTHTHESARYTARAPDIFSLFAPATTLPFPSSRELGVSRCILMKKFVTSLRHPAAAAAVAAAVAPAKKGRVGKRNE